jgi:hypothetical protein
VLRLPVLLAVTVVLVALLVVFYVELHGGRQIGLAERLLAGAQSLWPAVVTLSLCRAGSDRLRPCRVPHLRRQRPN